MMKPTLIPSATKDTLIVPKLKKGIDGKLVFKKIDYHMWFEVEIIYADKSLGRYKTTNFNEIILMFFQKLAKHNNGSPEFVELKLSKLEKNYLIDKIFIDNQLQNAENFSDKDDLKNKIIELISNRETLVEMGTKSYHDIEKMCSFSAYFEGLTKCYKDALDNIRK